MAKQINPFLAKLGDRKAAWDQVFDTFLDNPDVLDMTANALLTLLYESETFDWDSVFDKLTFGEFISLVDWSMREKSNQTTNPDKKNPAKNKEKPLTKNILDFLHKNPWSLSTSLATDLGIPVELVNQHLGLLKKQGLIKSVSKESITRYALS